MLKGKNIVVGVTGGIAAYKACDVVSRLIKNGANVDVIMTQSAQKFVGELTFRSLTGRPVTVDMFEKPAEYEIKHIALAKKADAFVIVPATANIIGKIAGGIADDMISTTVMAVKAPVIIAPAMNTAMYENPVVEENIQKLKWLGYIFCEPGCGRLACGVEGKGKLMRTGEIVDIIIETVSKKKDLDGLNILVSAGPTREFIDPVRFISNPSSGKTGYAFAVEAEKRGAKVTLVSGPVNLQAPKNVNVVKIESAMEMHKAMLENFSAADIIIKTAAVSDFRVKNTAKNKIKKAEFSTLELVENPDILKDLAKNKGNKIIIGFCMETKELEKEAVRKLHEKGADMIVANYVGQPETGFLSDYNKVSVYYKDKETEYTEKITKDEIAKLILDRALQLYNEKL